MAKKEEKIRRADQLALGGHIKDAYYFMLDLELAYKDTSFLVQRLVVDPAGERLSRRSIRTDHRCKSRG